MIAIFLFFNKSNTKSSRYAFSNEFRHCNVITFDGTNWVNYEMDKYGIHTRVLKVNDGGKLIKNLKVIKELTAMIAVDIENRAEYPWLPLWVRSCNELCRYVSGVGLGFCFNPVIFYKKLLRYGDSRNYEILAHWRRKDDERRQRK